ncbi:MAG: GatB/YqeY domain-containing protein [Caldisericum exile]
MELLEKIQKDYIQSMKEKDEIKASVLNMLRSQIKYKEIELKNVKNELEESDLIEIIRKEIKKREEAIEMYKQAGRQDLLSKEEKELEILKSYLPKLPSEEEIKAEIEKIIHETGAKDKKDFGKVMKLAMEKFKGIVDGAKIKEIVESILK